MSLPDRLCPCITHSRLHGLRHMRRAVLRISPQHHQLHTVVMATRHDGVNVGADGERGDVVRRIELRETIDAVRCLRVELRKIENEFANSVRITGRK